MRQIAAIWLARLPMELWREQSEETPRNIGVVLDDTLTKKRPFTPRGVTRLADSSDDLRKQGVVAPMRTLDAQRFAPAMRIEIVHDHAVDARLQALAELLLQVTPVVEPGCALGPYQNAIFLDLTGLGGDVRRHAARAQEILAKLRHTSILAIAPGKRLALSLARDPRAPTLRVVTSTERVHALRDLPLTAIGLEPDLVDTLRELGITTGGALDKLRRKDLAPRLHDAAKTTLALLAGHDRQPLNGIAPPDDIVEKVTLDFGVREIEPLLFLVRPLAERVIARLAARQEKLGKAFVRMRLQRPRSENPPFVDVRMPLVFPEPIDLASALVQAFSARLYRHGICDEAGNTVPDPEVVELGIEVARAGRVVASQQDAFSLGGAPPAALRALLGELWAELGEGAVGRLVSKNALLPERMTGLLWDERALVPAFESASLEQARALCEGGTFMTSWPWPIKLWRTPVRLQSFDEHALPFVQTPFALLEGEVLTPSGKELPFRRAYAVFTFEGGRRALGFEDEELEEIWVQGWFD